MNDSYRRHGQYFVSLVQFSPCVFVGWLTQTTREPTSPGVKSFCLMCGRLHNHVDEVLFFGFHYIYKHKYFNYAVHPLCHIWCLQTRQSGERIFKLNTTTVTTSSVTVSLYYGIYGSCMLQVHLWQRWLKDTGSKDELRSRKKKLH